MPELFHRCRLHAHPRTRRTLTSHAASDQVKGTIALPNLFTGQLSDQSSTCGTRRDLKLLPALKRFSSVNEGRDLGDALGCPTVSRRTAGWQDGMGLDRMRVGGRCTADAG